MSRYLCTISYFPSMQNLIKLTLIVFILSGCYATTDKYILPKTSADSLKLLSTRSAHPG